MPATWPCHHLHPPAGQQPGRGAAHRHPGPRWTALADPGKAVVVTGQATRSSRAAPTRPSSASRCRAASPTLPALIAAVRGFSQAGGGRHQRRVHGRRAGALALGAHYRSPRRRATGPAEVKLGLIPGAGGTQRPPRLPGLEASINMIVSGATVPGAQFKAHATARRRDRRRPGAIAAVALAEGAAEGPPLHARATT